MKIKDYHLNYFNCANICTVLSDAQVKSDRKTYQTKRCSLGLGTVSSIYKKLFDIINAQVIRGTNYHFIALLSGNLVSNTNMPHSAQELSICIFDVLSAT